MNISNRQTVWVGMTLAVFFFATGCDPIRPTPGKNTGNLLPINATNVTELGNGWFTFDLEVKGKTHSFVGRTQRTSDANYVVSFTEIGS